MLFFFSSRRRHTRLQGDWSSDVCSSDLSLAFFTAGCAHRIPVASREADHHLIKRVLIVSIDGLRPDLLVRRSEERRVGKEGGSGRPAHCRRAQRSRVEEPPWRWSTEIER